MKTWTIMKNFFARFSWERRYILPQRAEHLGVSTFNGHALTEIVLVYKKGE